MPSQLVNGEYVPQTNALPIIRKNSVFSTPNGDDFTLLDDLEFAARDEELNLIAGVSVGAVSGGNPVNFVLTANAVVSSSKIATEAFAIDDQQIPFRTITLAQENVTEIVSVFDTLGDTY
ncbi:MAG TPA: hypothetical protein DCM40_02330, partial [Maribacter sp.]|nr:hypothetical protein [Maribacter sp.]